MTTVLQERRTDVAEWEDALPPSPVLTRVLEEVERATAPREEPRTRPTPTTVRTPRPFAYD